MEEYIDINCRNILQRIKSLDISSQYAACSLFLDLIRPYFVQYKLHFKEKYFFRVRSHMEGNGEYYFRNISEVSYRTDFFSISKFGRCNCPFESVFYCSDNALLSLIEVTEIARVENKKEIFFHTTSIWKATQELNLTPIFERQNRIDRNKKMVEITNKCLHTIDEIKEYSKKEQLKEFHRAIGNEFTKPFSTDKNIYLLSSSISNYLLKEKQGQSGKIDGLVYPTCISHGAIRDIGLNYAFNPLVVGFGNKVEFTGAFRSKMEKRGKSFYEIERQKFKKANRFTGEIIW